MKRLISVLLALACMCACLCMAVGAEGETLTPPTDFTFDPETGDYSFTTTDDNAGYYFIRIYPVVNGVESDRYVSSSKRINAGKLGEKSGTMDLSDMGWGEYNVKLITFPASGTNYVAPDPVVLTAFYGVGGKLERPEMMVIADGNTAEMIVDWYTLSDYKTYQMLPTVEFNVYSDEACTELVDQATYDLAPLGEAAMVHPAGGVMWKNYVQISKELTSDHAYIFGGECNYAFVPEATFTLPAGTYYVTCTALAPNDMIEGSEPSEAVSFTVTDEEPNDEYVATKTSLWQDPALMGVMNATAGQAEGRVDSGADQVTTSKLA